MKSKAIALSKEEKDALSRLVKKEARKEVLELDEKFAKDADAATLYVLMYYYEFDHDKLINFWETAHAVHKDLRTRYELSNEESCKKYRDELKHVADIDIDELYANTEVIE